MNDLDKVIALLVILSLGCLLFAVLAAICDWFERRARFRDSDTARRAKAIANIEDWQRKRKP